jgi:hypothetical protein
MRRPTNTLKRHCKGRTKTVTEDWIREKQEGIRQAEWTSSENRKTENRVSVWDISDLLKNCHMHKFSTNLPEKFY